MHCPELCWVEAGAPILQQGDYLPAVPIPIPPLALSPNSGTVTHDTEVQVTDLIVVSHSCDFENEKLQFVALCIAISAREYDQMKSGFLKKQLAEVAKGRHEGLHALAPFPIAESDPGDAIIVDFRQIVSLPLDYVRQHAIACTKRYRLKSPYLEHFAQAFGRFYMRVGLPVPILQ